MQANPHLNVSKLIVGTVQFGLDYGVNNSSGKVSEDNAHAILSEAYKSGIRYLDTAKSYGTAHEVIGNFHRKNSDTIFKVITKIPKQESTENVSDKVREYIRELHVPKLEGFMFHAFSTYHSNKHTLPELAKLKADGLYNQLGVSIYTNKELSEVMNDDYIDLIQLPFNLLDNESQKGELLDEAKKKNTTIHTRSAFLQGLFFKNPTDKHPVANALQQQLTAIRNIAAQENISIEQLALGYCLQQRNIDNVLIGVDSIEQLISNIGASQHAISQSAVEQINRLQTHDASLLNPSLWK